MGGAEGLRAGGGPSTVPFSLSQLRTGSRLTRSLSSAVASRSRIFPQERESCSAWWGSTSQGAASRPSWHSPSPSRRSSVSDPSTWPHSLDDLFPVSPRMSPPPSAQPPCLRPQNSPRSACHAICARPTSAEWGSPSTSSSPSRCAGGAGVRGQESDAASQTPLTCAPHPSPPPGQAPAPGGVDEGRRARGSVTCELAHQRHGHRVLRAAGGPLRLGRVRAVRAD